MYKWLHQQLLRLQKLPEELLLQLRKSHLLVAAAMNAKEGQKSAAQQLIHFFFFMYASQNRVRKYSIVRSSRRKLHWKHYAVLRF